MINNLIFSGLICFLITFPSFSASNKPDIEQSVRSAKEKLSAFEVFSEGSSSQASGHVQSSIEEGQCKLKLVCYKCCVGEGPAKECDQQFHNWKKGKDCDCK